MTSSIHKKNPHDLLRPLQPGDQWSLLRNNTEIFVIFQVGPQQI